MIMIMMMMLENSIFLATVEAVSSTLATEDTLAVVKRDKSVLVELMVNSGWTHPVTFTVERRQTAAAMVADNNVSVQAERSKRRCEARSPCHQSPVENQTLRKLTIDVSNRPHRMAHFSVVITMLGLTPGPADPATPTAKAANAKVVRATRGRSWSVGSTTAASNCRRSSGREDLLSVPSS